MNTQEVFDKVVSHLRMQGAKSMACGPNIDELVCAYRGNNGRKCAVGCLIPDKEYDPRIEGVSVYTIIGSTNSFSEDTKNLIGANSSLLRDLQKVHDEQEVCNWDINFASLAQKYKLEYEPMFIHEQD